MRNSHTAIRKSYLLESLSVKKGHMHIQKELYSFLVRDIFIKNIKNCFAISNINYHPFTLFKINSIHQFLLKYINYEKNYLIKLL